MSISICATDIKSFSAIENSLKKLDKDFVDKFNYAEYVISGLEVIKLIHSRYVDEEIRLPKGFLIKDVRIYKKPEYKKDSNDDIKENIVTHVIINANFQEQTFIFEYTNVANSNLGIYVV